MAPDDEFDARGHWPDIDETVAFHAAQEALRAHRLADDALSQLMRGLIAALNSELTEQERREVVAILERWVEVANECLNGRDASALAAELVDALLSLEQRGVVPSGCAYAVAFAYDVSIDDLAPPV